MTYGHMQIGQLPLEQFVQVVVAWMGLAARPEAGGRRALEFAGFAYAAAVLLCTTESTAYLFLREGGLKRCAQALHDFQAAPAAPLLRLAAATLCMLLHSCGDVAVALISGAHTGPPAEAALLAPPWARPASTPSRFWTQPGPPGPPAVPAAPTLEPSGRPLPPDPGPAADATDAAADADGAGAAECLAADKSEDLMLADVAIERSHSSESLSENTSSLLGHSQSSQSLMTGDDHADGLPGAQPPPSPPPGEDALGDGVLSAARTGPAGRAHSPSPKAEAADGTGGTTAGEGADAGVHQAAVGQALAEVAASLAGQRTGIDVGAHEGHCQEGAAKGPQLTLDGYTNGSAVLASDGTAVAGTGVLHAAHMPDGRRQGDGCAEAEARGLPAGAAVHSFADVQTSGQHGDGDGPVPQADAPAVKRGCADLQDEDVPGESLPTKRSRLTEHGAAVTGAAVGPAPSPNKPGLDSGRVPVANGAMAAAADVAMVEAAVEAAGVPPEGDIAVIRLLGRCAGASGGREGAKDTLAEDEEFWAQLQVVLVPDADELADAPPLPELLKRALQLPQPRPVAALCALALSRLQVREALAAFASHTEALIGEVQQGRIQFRHVDNSIIVVAEALRRLTVVGAVLEREGGTARPWTECDAHLLRRLPSPRRGDACYMRCLAEHGVLRRCLQVLKLPALIVDSLVENGAMLSGAERRGLHRRLRSHFASPLRVRPNLLDGVVDRAVAAGIALPLCRLAHSTGGLHTGQGLWLGGAWSAGAGMGRDMSLCRVEGFAVMWCGCRSVGGMRWCEGCGAVRGRPCRQVKAAKPADLQAPCCVCLIAVRHQRGSVRRHGVQVDVGRR